MHHHRNEGRIGWVVSRVHHNSFRQLSSIASIAPQAKTLSIAVSVFELELESQVVRQFLVNPEIRLGNIAVSIRRTTPQGPPRQCILMQPLL